MANPSAREASVGVETGSVGVDTGSVGVDAGSVGVDTGSVGVDAGRCTLFIPGFYFTILWVQVNVAP